MKYILMHETVTNHDAIGNDIESMYNILCEIDSCGIFAYNQLNNSVLYINKEELESSIMNPDTVLIYHHSVYWEYGYNILVKAKCKIIIRYHNITPAHFFQDYNSFYYDLCSKGRELTKDIQKRIKKAFWLCDSKYNADELDIPESKIGICPPFNKIDELRKVNPDESIMRMLIDSNEVNLLWVGRVAPNKGHFQAIQIIHNYCNSYDKGIKLRIIGKFDEGLDKYNRIIREYIRCNNLEDNIEFIGEATEETILSYYLGSDLMLCCSQHEGFCVPIIEAQSFGLPIIALSSSAIPETLGENQICIEDNNSLFAAAIRIVTQNPEYYRFLRQKGFENFNSRFSYGLLRALFLWELERGCEQK